MRICARPWARTRREACGARPLRAGRPARLRASGRGGRRTGRATRGGTRRGRRGDGRRNRGDGRGRGAGLRHRGGGGGAARGARRVGAARRSRGAAAARARQALAAFGPRMAAAPLAADEAWLLVQVVQRDVPRVAPGAAVRFLPDALPGRAFAGRVDAAAAYVEATSRTAPVRVRVEDPEHVLRPGMTGAVGIVAGAPRRAVVVPTDAVVYDGAQPVVFVPAD